MSERILIVDDDKELRSELREFLDNYDISEASSGEEALKLLKAANNIDLVILDVMMPGRRGTDILKEMKKMDPDLGIIILTGYSSKDVAIEALKGHADDFIEKASGIKRIREVVGRILDVKNGQDNLDSADEVSKIEKVKKFIERNWDRKVSLSDVSKVVFLSSKYLSRVFKQKTGKSFLDYKLNIKMEKAKELLTETGCNINQISEKLGYENTESFIRQFENLVGPTPTGYRNKSKKAQKPRKKQKKKSKR